MARGLVRQAAIYKEYLAACGGPRRGFSCEPGTFGEAGLTSCAGFQLYICIDQVKFMEGPMRPERLRGRVVVQAKEEICNGALPSGSGIVTALNQRQIQRGEVGCCQ